MKRFILTILLVSFLVASCSSANAPIDTSPTVESGQVALIGIDARLPRFEEIDIYSEDQAVQGFDVDLLQGISEITGLEYELIKGGYIELLTAVGQCQLDAMISAIPISDKLKQQVAFSDPYYTTTQVLVIKEGNIKITGLDTLTDMRVGATVGTPSEIEVEKIAGAVPDINGTFDAAFQDLTTGYSDAVIADKPRGLAYTEVKPFRLKIIGEEFSSISYGIAICKSNTELLAKINEGIATLNENGTLKRLTRKWITNYRP